MSVRILVGDCRARLAELPDNSVHTCITSPPYFGLRDYQVNGQIGLEQSPSEFLSALVTVFRDVHRVLRDDGTLWLNIGDSYATVGGAHGGRLDNQRGVGAKRTHDSGGGDQAPRKAPLGFKPKDLMLMPARLAIALCDDGWFVRSDIIWHKPNPMPESVTDRPTKSHEHLYLLTKSESYFYDAAAIAEPAVTAHEARYAGTTSIKQGETNAGTGKTTRRFGRSGNTARKPASARGVPIDTLGGTNGAVAGSVPWEGITRNRRDVWTVPVRPFKGAHFATFPPALIEPCVLAGAPPSGTVLDPFGGAGTTGMVANRHGRHATLIELNPEYARMAEARILADDPLCAEVAVEGAL